MGTSGEIGHGEIAYKCKQLTKAETSQRFKMVAASGSHCAAITEDFECYTWGSGSSGKLGHSLADRVLADRLIPKHVEYFLKTSKVTTGNKLQASSLWQQRKSFFHIIQKKSDDIQKRGAESIQFEAIERMKLLAQKRSMVTNISCSQNNTFFVRLGKLYSVGKCQYGILGTGEPIDNPMSFT